MTKIRKLTDFIHLILFVCTLFDTIPSLSDGTIVGKLIGIKM